jgi:ADP-ribose pyrophosphatase YjhB (NUDIX family)
MLIKPIPMYVAVKALIFQGEKLLLLLKTQEKFWDLPGGRIDPSENIIAALKREVTEELPDFKSYSIKKLIGIRKQEQPLSDGNELFLSYFLVESLSESNRLTLSSEHSDAKYFSYYEVSKLEHPLNLVYGGLMEKVLNAENPQIQEITEKNVII